MFEAVIFDMDGVITDSEKLYRRYQLETGLEYGISKEEMTRACEQIAGGNRYTNRETFRRLFGEGIDYFEFRDKMLVKLDAHIEAYGVELKPGVRETLSALHDKGIKVGLATSTDEERAKRNLSKNDILQFFDELVFGSELPPGHGKPNPEIYLKACEKLGVAPENTVGVEDSKNGVKAVRAAGMYSVMVVDLIAPDAETAPHTDRVYERMDEMLELFLTWKEPI